jgi:prophage endopeptidase
VNAYALIAIAVFSFGSGWVTQSWRMGEQIARINLATSKTLQDIAVTAANKQRELQNEIDKERDRLSVVEFEQYTIMRNAEDKTRQLNDDVNALRQRLLVNASCPARSDRLPETSTDASVGERSRPELNPDARPTYNTLRNGIATLESQLAYYRARCK